MCQPKNFTDEGEVCAASQPRNLADSSQVGTRRRLIGDFVVAGCAAVLTVEKAVFTKPDIQLALTKTTVLLTFATFFDLFALTAAGFGLGGHKQTVAPKAPPRERAVGN
jgi:hypothetical protein